MLPSVALLIQRGIVAAIVGYVLMKALVELSGADFAKGSKGVPGPLLVEFVAALESVHSGSKGAFLVAGVMDCVWLLNALLQASIMDVRKLDTT